MSIFRHKAASSESLRLALVKLWRDKPQRFWSQSTNNYYSSDDEDDTVSFRGAENKAGEQGGLLGREHIWDINRYHRQLEYAAKYLNMKTKGKENVLVVNLGPSNPMDSFLQTLFDNRVVDLPEGYHEKPPGSGVLPLDVLFSLCSCMKSWLDLSKEHIVLLHLRNSTGNGMGTLKFVQYCFMAYNGSNEEIDNPFSSFAGGDSKLSGEFVAEILWNSVLGASINQQCPVCRIGGPSQQRYSKYFLHILFSPTPPPQKDTGLKIKKITFDGVNTLRRSKNARVLEHLLFYTPYMVIHQKGVELWKGQATERGSTIEFNVEACVTGDAVVGLWFIKGGLLPGQQPTIVFAFHRAFMSPGEFVFSSGRLDLGSSIVAGDLTMKINFEDTGSPIESKMDGSLIGSNIHELRRIWLEQQPLSGGVVRAPSHLPSRQEKQDPLPAESLNSEFQDPMQLSPWELPNGQNSEEVKSFEVEKDGEHNNIPHSAQLATMDVGVGCTLLPSDGCSEDEEACVNESTEMNDAITPVVDEEAPSTPSAAETGSLRASFRDENSGAGPGPCSESSECGESCEVPIKKAIPAPPPPPPPPAKLRALRTPPPPPMQKASSERPLARTRSFFWTKTPKQSGTIWCELTNNDVLPDKMSQLLYDMFGVDESKKNGSSTNINSRAPSPEMQKKGGVKVVSTGRATNVSIMMNRFKSFDGGLEGLCKAVLSGEGLLIEDLKLLSQIAPREDEVRAFGDYEGEKHELSSPEQILVDMIEVPRLKQKAHCWVMMDQWESNYWKATNMLHVTKMACQEVKESERLRSVLQSVLMVGNSMNKGTHRGNAGGCRVESLLRLPDTKVTGYSVNDLRKSEPTTPRLPFCDSPLAGESAEDEIASLLDFVVLVVNSERGDDIISEGTFLLEDLQSFSEASNYLDGSVEELLDEVWQGFEAIELEIEAALGKKWSKIQTMSREDVQQMSIRNSGKYVEKEEEFVLALYQFLQSTMEDRVRLRGELSVCEQYLKSAATWLGEPENADPKRVLRDLFEFARTFDDSFRRLSSY